MLRSFHNPQLWLRDAFAPDNGSLGCKISRMSTATAKLVSEFEALRIEDKQEFVREIIHRLPPWDSGPLSDDVATTAGDELAAIHHEEELAS
jgi:hypothetical protein